MLKTCGPSTSRRMWRRTMARIGKRRRSSIDARTTRHASYGMSQKRRKMIACIFGWGKQHGTMRGEASRGCWYRRRILAEPHRLQPDPHPEIGCRIGELCKDTRKSLLCRAKRLNPRHKAPHRNGKTSNFPVFPQTAKNGKRESRMAGETRFVPLKSGAFLGP
jgi:hypothetical protein